MSADRPKTRRCVVCNRRPAVGLLMCKPCGKSLDAHHAKDDGSLSSTIEWAARRARYFASARRRREHPLRYL